MKIYEKPKAFYDDFFRKGGNTKTTHYCPGCGHGVIQKLIAEAIDDLGIQDRTIFVSPVGCAVFCYYYFDVGNMQVSHGRAPAVSTGIKRTNPDSIVISYQGDGDLAAIGTAETIHAANRGENITVFFVNNAIYGMTGGQMAPTTLLGQVTKTTPLGRQEDLHGNPIRVAEIIATLPAAHYVERVMIGDAKDIMQARKAIRRGLQNQIEGKGYSFIEILSPCPTNWGMDPVKAKAWCREQMTQIFPVGVLKDSTSGEEGKWHRKVEPYNPQAIDHYLENIIDVGELASLDGVSTPDSLQCKFAGFGGQGILTLGLMFAQLAMRAQAKVSWIPSYGPEMRGGTANCAVNISKSRIGSPMADKPNVLCVMNQPSLDAFEKTIQPGGLLVLDSFIVEKKPTRTDIRVVSIPASQMASELGNPKVANVILMGAIIAALDLYPLSFVQASLGGIIKKKSLLAINQEALLKGYNAVKGL